MNTSPAGSSFAPLRCASRLLNRFALLVAGTRIFPLYGVLRHRGRRSGKLYEIPVVVRSSLGGLVIPMPWGQSTDWFLNVKAAGGCTILWKGREYLLTEPSVVSVRESFGAFQASFMARMGIQECCLLRV